MRRFKFLLAAALFAVVPAFATANAQQATGSIHGHVQDPAGVTLSDGTITLSTDGGKTAKYTFTTDANGDYKGTGIAPDTYTLTLRQPTTPLDKAVDQFPAVKITAGQDTLQDFDMTRPEYIKNLTPEQRKAAEDLKAKNAAALKENSVIKNLNANLLKAREDNKNKNYAEADSLMSQASAAKPDAAVLWLELGIALGEVLANQKKVPDSQAAYEAAAKVNPTQAGLYYQNEAIVMDRTGNIDATVAATDKAIAADPTKPIPYYLKGKALINKATVDTKTGKIVAPPGCAEAYQKYLELAPQGQFAPEVTQLLTEMGQTIKSTYKAKK